MYSIRVPGDWTIDNSMEDRELLPDDTPQFTKFSRDDGAMYFTISKMFTRIPQFDCVPRDVTGEKLTSFNIGDVSTYRAVGISTTDEKGEPTTTYTYCVNVHGKKYRFSFVPISVLDDSDTLNFWQNLLITLTFSPKNEAGEVEVE